MTCSILIFKIIYYISNLTLKQGSAAGGVQLHRLSWKIVEPFLIVRSIQPQPALDSLPSGDGLSVCNPILTSGRGQAVERSPWNVRFRW